MDQIRVLQHLRKEEAVLEIAEASSARHIDIVQLRIPAPNSTSRVDSHKRIPRPVSVHLVARCSVSVVHALEVLGTEHVVAGCDVEAGLLVEGLLISGRRWIIGILRRGGVFNPLEHFRADAGGGACICVVAAIHESDAEVDVLLLFEDETTEDEGSTVEAGHFGSVST